MKVVILTSSALVDPEKGIWAGLAETAEVSDERGEYLLSVGAAKEVGGEKDGGDQVPGNATSTNPAETDEKVRAEEKKAAPVRRAAPKSK